MFIYRVHRARATQTGIVLLELAWKDDTVNSAIMRPWVLENRGSIYTVATCRDHGRLVLPALRKIC